MFQLNIERLITQFHEVLYLDLDEFGLASNQEEITSSFTGLRLRSTFQPIWNSAKFDSPLGYEALMRASIGNEPVSPAFAFSVANNHGKLVKLDRVARTLHLLNYLNLPDDKGLLFVNLHPDLLVNVITHGKVYERVLQTHSIPTNRVVIEIMENAVEADRPLIDAVKNYRGCGYRIAIDNFGSKHSNFDRLWKLSPGFVKLDTGIIQRAQSNLQTRRVLPKLLDIIRELGAQAIIVGIENETQYQIALDSGGTLLQGYFLGRPAPVDNWVKLREKAPEIPIMPDAPDHFGSFGVVENAAFLKHRQSTSV